MIIYLNRRPLQVPDGISVAAALAFSGDEHTRLAVNGAPRAPYCGMGVCQECRLSIDGRRQLACQTLCREGMHVEREA